jgi:hypothetical protein
MYCWKCGEQNDDNAFRCVKCGEIIQVVVAPQSSGIENDPAMRLLLPVGRSWLAIAAGYMGLFAILLIPAPFAILLGILAIRDIKRHPDLCGTGRAIFGIIMGVLGCIGLVAILVSAGGGAR